MKNKSKKISKYYRRTKNKNPIYCQYKIMLHKPIEKLNLSDKDKIQLNNIIDSVSNMYDLSIKEITGAMFSCIM